MGQDDKLQIIQQIMACGILDCSPCRKWGEHHIVTVADFDLPCYNTQDFDTWCVSTHEFEYISYDNYYPSIYIEGQFDNHKPYGEH